MGTLELLELEDWKPNKLQALFLCRQSKQNLASSRVVISFWVKLLPSWMGHTVGIIGLATTNFFIVPLAQWLKLWGQN
jgi:aromatic ring hydroxylase